MDMQLYYLVMQQAYNTATLYRTHTAYAHTVKRLRKTALPAHYALAVQTVIRQFMQDSNTGFTTATCCTTSAM